jgi:hypothetical protein
MKVHNLSPEVLFLCKPCNHESLDVTSFMKHLTHIKHLRKLQLSVECIEIPDSETSDQEQVIPSIIFSAFICYNLDLHLQKEDVRLMVADVLDEVIGQSIENSPSELVSSIVDDIVTESIEQSPSEICRNLLDSIVDDAIAQSPSHICSTIINEILDEVVPEEGKQSYLVKI